MYFSVDRIEGETAVLERDGSFVRVPLRELPEGTREGSLLKSTRDGYILDNEGAEERRAALAERTARLFGRRGGRG